MRAPGTPTATPRRRRRPLLLLVLLGLVLAALLASPAPPAAAGGKPMPASVHSSTGSTAGTVRRSADPPPRIGR
jgi:hypothetical protein